MSIFCFLNASRFSGQVTIASDIDLDLFPIEGDFPKFLLIDLENWEEILGLTLYGPLSHYLIHSNDDLKALGRVV